MLRAVEGHVLQEVGKTTLRLVLINRAYTLGNIEIGNVFGILVVTDVIGQSVVQFTNAHSWVNGDGRHLHGLSHHSCRTDQHQRSYKKFSQFHRFLNIVN